MPLIRFKPLALAFMVLTFFSAVGGVLVYYMHTSVLNTLANPPSLGESLDRVSYMEYTIKLGEEEYLVKVYNNPGDRSGRAEIYKGSELLYVIYYKYGENSLLSVEMEKDGEKQTLNPVDYEEAFITSLKASVGPGGGVNAEPFPGIAPLQAVYYITRSMGINWDSFIRGLGPGVPVDVNVSFRSIETPQGSSRGVLVIIVPRNPVLATSVWMKAPFSFELGRIGDVTVATRIIYDVTLETGGQGIAIELKSIEFSKS